MSLILGVDPGSAKTGYALISQKEGHLSCVHFGCISPPRGSPYYSRLYGIFMGISDVIDTFRPDELAIEDVFSSVNVRSAIKLGQIRGAVFVASMAKGLSIYEYAPRRIKEAIVGYGNASKEQVNYMVKRILHISEELDLNTSDAMAVAICHANVRNPFGHQLT